MIIRKILDWLSPPETIDNELRKTVEDISFLTDKIRVARRIHSDVIAKKMIGQRSKLIEKHERLLEKRRHSFNN